MSIRTPVSIVALAAALLAAGCQIVLFPWPASEPVPSLVGAWQGTWMITPPLPMRVVITGQDGTKVSGVVTYEPRSGAISMGITGQLGVRNGELTLLMTVAGLDRTDDFEFRTIEFTRLEGRGRGSGLGGQQGPVLLERR